MNNHVLTGMVGCPRDAERAMAALTLLKTVPSKRETHSSPSEESIPPPGSTPGQEKLAGRAQEAGFCRLWTDKKQIQLIAGWEMGICIAF